MALVKNGTLTAGAAASLSVEGCANGLWIYNLSQTGVIWVRVDGTTATVAGDDCYAVLSRRFITTSAQGGRATVSLISSAALNYSVEANSEGGPE